MSVESDTRRNFHVNDLNPPSAPGLAAQPANGVTWAPTRLYLSWTASVDIDPGDSITGYDIYFVEGTSVPTDTCPYKRVSATTTNFIIQASTDGRAVYVPDMTAPTGISCSMTSGGTRPIYLQAPDTGMMTRNYAWKICAVNNHNVRTCSEERQFNTDDSVVGWWRFDESPTGPVCPRGLGGLTAPGGDAGETVCDYSGKGNHGVPHGNPMWLPPMMGSMAGILGGALQFDGVDDWVEVANNPSLNFNSTDSIGIELNLNLIAGNGEGSFVISKGSGATHGNYAIVINPTIDSNLTFTYTSRETPLLVSTYLSNLGLNVSRRSHILTTYSFGSITSVKFNKDGTFGTGSWVGGVGNEAPITSLLPLSIGRRTAPTTLRSYYNGVSDEILLYKSYLSDAYIINSDLTNRN